MTSDVNIYSGLTEVFHEVFGDDTIVLNPDTTSDQVPGWDSIKMVTIMIGIEERFQIKLRSRDVDQLKNVGDLATVIKGKLA